MPFTFTQIAATGDPLPANRHILQFPSLPGSLDGQALTLRHTTVTLPPLQIGQILLKLAGWPISFAGIRVMQNTFSAEFIETKGSPVVKTLVAWSDKCAGFRTHRSLSKKQYAVNSQCIACDTAGKKALIVDLLSVWPMSVTFGNYVEESSPVHVSVEFSLDAMDIKEVEYNEQDFTSGSLSAANTSYSGNSLSAQGSNARQLLARYF